jgi:hypothetical protein
MSLNATISNSKDVRTVSLYETKCENPLYKNLVYGLVGSAFNNFGTYPFTFNRTSNQISYS